MSAGQESKITMVYDAAARRAVFTDNSGLSFMLGNVTEEKANEWRDRHAQEFFRRRCRMHSVGGHLTREGDTDG
jgi:hypothetical protein